MIVYQQRTLDPAADVGTPGPLPLFLVGLADETLADLPAGLDVAAVEELGLANTGYLPVEVPDPAPDPVVLLPLVVLLQRKGLITAADASALLS
jgi:hypothetical protein